MITRAWRTWIGGVLGVACALAVLVAAPAARAAGPIVLDGAFGDWSGRSFIADPQGDASKNNGQGDIRALYWGTNPNDPTLYLMIEKWDAVNQPPIWYVVQFDINNDGDYQDVVDRQLLVLYTSNARRSSVTVSLFNGEGDFLNLLALDEPWGDAGAGGGTRCEFKVSFQDLGIVPHQAITMRAFSEQGGSQDSTAFVQISPANALGYLLLGVALLAAAWHLAQRRRVMP